MKKELNLDGSRILNEEQFHTEISSLLKFPDYYGKNLDALWDCLTGEIDTEIKLVWTDHKASENALGERFESICVVFRDLQKEVGHFEFELR